ncbi:MAG TPA: hydrogenase maturation nickel metallochaperone HypA [Sediminibacterium sp.]|nr:hydrogenase maturation nickel metallochaperone HypA [Sediminibacterium sp.]
MHELSIVMSILEIAEIHAAGAGAESVEAIELEIGCLSGIEMDAFEFAWKQAVKNTLLAGAVRTIHRIPGEAICPECSGRFPVQSVLDDCPQCGNPLIAIQHGKELRIKSLLVPEKMNT